jgi:hypothetical protein
MHKPLSDSGIYIKKLEESLMCCFEQWKEVTVVLYSYLGKSESGKVKDFDLIDCFCRDVKNRLTELRRRGVYHELWRFG